MVTKLSGAFFKIYCIKEKFIFVSRWFSFGLFNFMESFSFTWISLLKMVFHITVITNFSIGRTFTTVVRIFANLELEVWLLDFECFEILCRLMVSFDLRILQACLKVSTSNMTSRYCFRKSQFRFMKDTLSNNYYACHKQSYPLLKSHG